MTRAFARVNFSPLKHLRSILLFLCALHLAVGPTNLFQLVAWGKMLLDYSQTHTLAKATEMTFDGQHPCSLCNAIAEARETEKEDPAKPSQSKSPERLELFTSEKVALKTLSSRTSTRGPNSPASLLGPSEGNPFPLRNPPEAI